MSVSKKRLRGNAPEDNFSIKFPTKRADTLSEQEKEWIRAFYGIYLPASRIAKIITRPVAMVARYLKDLKNQKFS